VDREALTEFWGYDPVDDMRKLEAVRAWFAQKEPVVKAALVAATLLVGLGVADLTRWSVPDHIVNDRQIALIVVVEAVLLALVYWVVDDAADRRTGRQWEAIAGPAIASLRLNMILTHQRLEHAVRHVDDDVAWTAMGESARWFAQHVQSSQPLLVVHPDLAAFAPRFMEIAARIAERAGGFDERRSIRRVAEDQGVRGQSEMLRRAIEQLATDTATYDDQYGPFSEPGTD
jgi:hypothetical protein